MERGPSSPIERALRSRDCDEQPRVPRLGCVTQKEASTTCERSVVGVTTGAFLGVYGWTSTAAATTCERNVVWLTTDSLVRNPLLSVAVNTTPLSRCTSAARPARWSKMM